MATSNYGFIGAGGAAGVQAGIQDVLAKRAEAQELAFNQWIKEIETEVKVGDLNLRRDEFGEKRRVTNLELPGQIAYRQAQTDDLNRRPGESALEHQRRLEQDRAKAGLDLTKVGVEHTNELAKLLAQHGYSLEEIQERARQQRATDAANPANKTAAGGEHLPAAVDAELRKIDEVDTLSQRITELGTKTGWAGIGGFGYGTGAEFLKKNLGWGSDDAQALRGNLANLRQSVSSARAGLTLTDSEKEMLDRYIGDRDSNPEHVQVNLRELATWAKNRKASIAQRYNRPELLRAAPRVDAGDGAYTGERRTTPSGAVLGMINGRPVRLTPRNGQWYPEG